jgi:transposase
VSSNHGPGLRRQRNRPTGTGPGFIPVVPPKCTRIKHWEYDRAMYRRPNEVERLFRRLKGFRRIFSRFDKLDLVFLAFIHFALIIEALR